MKKYCLDARAANDHFPGIGRYISNLASALVPQLAEDESLLLLRDTRQPSGWDLPGPGCQVSWIDLPLSLFGLRQQWALPALLRREKPQVYHSPYYLMPYFPGVPTVLTLYDLIPQLYPETVSLKARFLFSWAARLAVRAADQMLAISQATRRDYREAFKIPENRITAVPLAPAAHFTPQPTPEIDRVRKKYRLGREFVLYIGINKPHKNLPALIQAWQALARQDVDLVIGGAWDARYPEARQLAARSAPESIRFIGPVPEADLPALYAGALFFVFPSLYEGFGLPVIEAMACGAAVACSQWSSLPEVAGDAAHLFDPANPAAIQDALQTLLRDGSLRVALRKQAPLQAARFTWEQTAAETLAVYRKTTRQDAAG
jgi:alpha-1,3-rhamnosyl/mannosyltransferase